MRLVLGARSAKGLEVFRDVQGRIERIEIETRNRARKSGGQEISLFSGEEIAAMQQNAAGIGIPRFQRETEECIREFLSSRVANSISAIWPETLEIAPIRWTQLRTLVLKLQNKGIGSFDLPPRKRVPQPETLISLVDQSA